MTSGTCQRCGAPIKSRHALKRAEQGEALLCSSCTAKPAKSVATAFGWCKPHHGQFDSDDNPLDDHGKLYRAGIRLCRNRDCVEQTHIVDPSFFEGLDLSYRTGVKLTPDEILAMLEREKWGRSKDA